MSPARSMVISPGRDASAEACAQLDALALRLGIPRSDHPPPDAAVISLSRDGGLQLTPPAAEFGEGAALRIDLSATKRQDPRRSLLARALGIPRGVRHVLDATAGLGADSIAVLRAGCRVTLCERTPWLAAMLEQALTGPLAFGDRATVHSGDACALLETLAASDEEAPDAVYLDPMFGDRDDCSALPKRSIRTLRAYTETAGSEEQQAAQDAGLFAAAQRAARRRVVVKRRRGAPPMTGAGPAPNEVSGKLVRFDIYPPMTKPT